MLLAQLGEIAEVMDVREFDFLRRKDGLQRLLDSLLCMLCELPDYVEGGCGSGCGGGDRGLGVGIIVGV